MLPLSQKITCMVLKYNRDFLDNSKRVRGKKRSQYQNINHYLSLSHPFFVTLKGEVVNISKTFISSDHALDSHGLSGRLCIDIMEKIECSLQTGLNKELNKEWCWDCEHKLFGGYLMYILTCRQFPGFTVH